MLNERKLKILEAIVKDYIETAEPIGSRTIEKKYNLGISSATIRNEMSDLEEMGYIIQPHTSSGRVPSDKGYRLYVDNLMNYRELTLDEATFLKNIIANNINHMEYLMKETAKAISLLTNYTTIVSEPTVNKTKISHVQLMPMDEKSIALALITDSKAIKNHVVLVDFELSDAELNNLTQILNSWLRGRAIDEVDVDNVKMSGDSNISKVFYKVLDAIKNIILQEKNVNIYTSGVNNMLDFPEFSDIEKVKSLFKTFEERDVLITLLGESSADDIQIVIGAENSIEQMKDLSIIKANYQFKGRDLGAIGIVGPKRMDYFQVSSILNGIVKNINDILRNAGNDDG
ncbi:MAG: heat-inducible transcriptional repressor HrcA [Defluviitaleaceae bacterium]|nr:heat-inducible transcriptional repressor HrcA [Defluviitaleaceae bacterium]